MTMLLSRYVINPKELNIFTIERQKFKINYIKNLKNSTKLGCVFMILERFHKLEYN